MCAYGHAFPGPPGQVQSLVESLVEVVQKGGEVISGPGCENTNEITLRQKKEGERDREGEGGLAKYKQ